MFELFVAGRYLRARRKERVISVITVISVAGVAAGVMALIVSLAVNNGFRNSLQSNLLAATAHINVVPKQSNAAIANWEELDARFLKIPHIIAVSPVLYDENLIEGPVRGKYATIKGIYVQNELAVSDTLHHLKTGSLSLLTDDHNGFPGLIIGSKLAQDTGLSLNGIVRVISPEGNPTPLGPTARVKRFRVAGTFETEFYEVDDTWAYAPIDSIRNLLILGDVVNSIEIKNRQHRSRPRGRRPGRARGRKSTTSRCRGRSRTTTSSHALQMERAVTWITIGMIVLVGALNVLLITLTMIVLTKYRDIAVLMSMGARRRQIRTIFVTQGAIIGLVGTAIGTVVGYSLCYFAQKYRLVPLNESVYSLSFVPFEPRAWDGVWIAAAAMAVSLLATLYPARNATAITPVEVLRYE